MNYIDLSPSAHSGNNDEEQLAKLYAERERILAQKGYIGRVATRFAAVFHRGDLGENAWLTDRHQQYVRARKNTQD